MKTESGFTATRVKVSDLSGPALDWAVAVCEEARRDDIPLNYWTRHGARIANHFHPSGQWSDAGPIIEREDIVILRDCDDHGVDSQGFTTSERFKVWRAVRERGGQQPTRFAEYECYVIYYDAHEGYSGPTPLIAAMRCYVASKLGDTVEIPEELI